MTAPIEELVELLLKAVGTHVASVDRPLLSSKEVGLIIGRHEKTVLQLVRDKKLTCIRQDARSVQFSQRHVDEYLASCEVPASTAEPKPTRNPKYSR